MEFSINTKQPLQQVQKVEFYVGDKLVGAAFAEPFTISMQQNDLMTGTHTVTAKVYTAQSTTQTTPALFTTESTLPPPLSNEESELPVKTRTNRGLASSQPGPVPTIASPAGVVATVSPDGTNAQVSWDAVTGAIGYQVWRDGMQIATVTATTFTDPGLASGQTYDYRLTAIDANGMLSDFSEQVAVTMPARKNDLKAQSAPATSNSGTTPAPDYSSPPASALTAAQP